MEVPLTIGKKTYMARIVAQNKLYVVLQYERNGKEDHVVRSTRFMKANNIPPAFIEWKPNN